MAGREPGTGRVGGERLGTQGDDGHRGTERDRQHGVRAERMPCGQAGMSPGLAIGKGTLEEGEQEHLNVVGLVARRKTNWGRRRENEKTLRARMVSGKSEQEEKKPPEHPPAGPCASFCTAGDKVEDSASTCFFEVKDCHTTLKVLSRPCP